MGCFLLPEHSLHTILIARAVMVVRLLGAIFTAQSGGARGCASGS